MGIRCKCYTGHEANQVLPLVRSIANSVVREYRWLCENGARRRNMMVADGDEVTIKHLSHRVSESMDRLEGFLGEMESMGLRVADLENGVVEFPTYILGHEALFVWTIGEESVSRWRRPADREAVQIAC